MKLLVDGSKASVETCTREFGMVTTQLSDKERLKWANGMDNIALESANRVEKQGIPGCEILKFCMDHMRDGGQIVTRDWDRASAC